MGSLTMQMGARIPAPAHDLAYQLQQRGMLFPCLLGHRVMRLIAGKRIQVDEDAVVRVRRRYDELLARDLENVRQGLYDKELLFQFPFVDYLKAAPSLLADFPRTLRRLWRGDFQDLPDRVALERYPDYYRRNFHWQTDGYLSRRSANIYDVGVEFLFLGAADVMRRQVIPPVSRFIREEGDDLRLLDVACGTGRMLKQLAVAHPTLRYYGLDLSPYYLQHARELLADVEDLSLIADRAEAMPFRDDYFDVVTSVYMFHELPKKVRREVYAEMWRVLRPGGLLVIEDSAQQSESGELAFFLGRFSEDFHEPFHRGYMVDDIGAGREAQGLVDVQTAPCFVSKVVTARKPAGAVSKAAAQRSS
ncbi:MAG: class I SAM-dependent methyltransferase [Polyangiaceae bacterium]